MNSSESYSSSLSSSSSDYPEGGDEESSSELFESEELDEDEEGIVRRLATGARAGSCLRRWIESLPLYLKR
jgi:hypothetical protein